MKRTYNILKYTIGVIGLLAFVFIARFILNKTESFGGDIVDKQEVENKEESIYYYPTIEHERRELMSAIENQLHETGLSSSIKIKDLDVDRNGNQELYSGKLNVIENGISGYYVITIKHTKRDYVWQLTDFYPSSNQTPNNNTSQSDNETLNGVYQVYLDGTPFKLHGQNMYYDFSDYGNVNIGFGSSAGFFKNEQTGTYSIQGNEVAINIQTANKITYFNYDRSNGILSKDGMDLKNVTQLKNNSDYTNPELEDYSSSNNIDYDSDCFKDNSSVLNHVLGKSYYKGSTSLTFGYSSATLGSGTMFQYVEYYKITSRKGYIKLACVDPRYPNLVVKLNVYCDDKIVDLKSYDEFRLKN